MQSSFHPMWNTMERWTTSSLAPSWRHAKFTFRNVVERGNVRSDYLTTDMNWLRSSIHFDDTAHLLQRSWQTGADFSLFFWVKGEENTLILNLRLIAQISVFGNFPPPHLWWQRGRAITRVNVRRANQNLVGRNISFFPGVLGGEFKNIGCISPTVPPTYWLGKHRDWSFPILHL